MQICTICEFVKKSITIFGFYLQKYADLRSIQLDKMQIYNQLMCNDSTHSITSELCKAEAEKRYE
jgi:hypothetical protein